MDRITDYESVDPGSNPGGKAMQYVLTLRPGVFTGRTMAQLYEATDFLYLNNVSEIKMWYEDYKQLRAMIGASPRMLFGIRISVIDPPLAPNWLEGECVAQT